MTIRLGYSGRVESNGPPAHSGSVSFLLSQVGAYCAAVFAETLAPYGITPRAYGVISNLDAAGTMTQQQLADSLGIHRNNMVGLIDDLEASGWVRRERSQRDRRAFNVRLTPEGADVTRAVGRLLPGLDDAVAEGLSRRDRERLAVLLAAIADARGLRRGVHPSLRSRPA